MAITISGSGITSANILDGTIATADLADTYLTPTGDGSGLTGAGYVIQIVPWVGTGHQVTTSSYVNITAAQKAITTTKLNSRIIYMVTIPYEIDTEPKFSYWTVSRDGTRLNASTTNGNGDDNYTCQVTVLYTDSPNVAAGTTLTYSTHVHTDGAAIDIGQDSLPTQPTGTTNNIQGYLMEVI